MNARSVLRGAEVEALADVILDAFPVSGSTGLAALALALVKRARASRLPLETVQRAVADMWHAVADSEPEGGAS